MSEIKQYIYMDPPRIDSTCAQIGVEIANKKIIQTQEDSSAFDTSAGASFIKNLPFNFSRKKDHKSGTTTETEYAMSNELKIDYLLKHVFSSDCCQYFTNLTEAMRNAKYADTSFVYINETFYAPEFCNNPNNFGTITDSGFIEFEYGKPVNSILAFDTPYKLQNPYTNYVCRQNFGPHIYLIMSISQLLYEKPDIYLYNLLKHSEGVLRMGVFGFIVRLTDYIYHINPLAVWI